MPSIPNVPIDWASIDWLYVGVLAVFVFVSSLIGRLLSFKHAFIGAVLSTLLFSAAFVFWTYYPHGLPLPITARTQSAPVQSAAPATPPATAAAPRHSPVTTISPETTPSSPPASPSGSQ